MKWKTCSLEAMARIGNSRNPGRAFGRKRILVSGMQKDELTMFRTACYSSLVPRVYPGLVCAATFCGIVCEEERTSFRENKFPGGRDVRRHSSLKRSCGAFRPNAEGYAGQG